MILDRRLGSVALPLIIVAAAASPASARPIDQPLALQPAHSTGGVDTQVRVVEVPADASFDWAGAGIGAGAMLAATGLGGALMLTVRRRHRRAATPA
jgi:hypothetical protein